jgi:hypothetical protein
MPWQSPSLTVKWGPYFAPDPDEQNKIVTMVQEALGGTAGTPLITLRAAVEKIAPIFGIENIDAAIEQLEKEREENANRELDAATAALNAEARAFGTGPNAPGKPPAKGGDSGRPPGGQKPSGGGAK